MPKMKTHKGAAKRFKLTGSGKIMRTKAYKSHILTKKNAKRKRNLGQEVELSKADYSRVRKQLGDSIQVKIGTKIESLVIFLIKRFSSPPDNTALSSVIPSPVSIHSLPHKSDVLRLVLSLSKHCRRRGGSERVHPHRIRRNDGTIIFA